MHLNKCMESKSNKEVGELDTREWKDELMHPDQCGQQSERSPV